MGFFDNLFGFDDMIKNQRNDIIDLRKLYLNQEEGI